MENFQVYDTTFRAIIQEYPKLILPLLNDAFGTHYTGEEEVTLGPCHVLERDSQGNVVVRVVDSYICVRKGTEVRWFHIECQSRSDSTILIRLFEYMVGLSHNTIIEDKNVLTATVPDQAVLYLRSTRNTPNSLLLRLKNSRNEVLESEVKVIKLKSYSADDLTKKDLQFLMPFYAFRYENLFSRFENEGAIGDAMAKEFSKIKQYLISPERDPVTSLFLLERLAAVHNTLMEKYPTVRKELQEIMTGAAVRNYAQEMAAKYERKGRIDGKIEAALSFGKEMSWSNDFILQKVVSMTKLDPETAKKHIEAYKAEHPEYSSD